MERLLALLVITAFAVVSPARAAVSDGVQVPRAVGETESAAQCALAAHGLRWRFRGDRHVYAFPSAGVCRPGPAGLSDPKVLAQSPSPGHVVARDTIVVLDDVCLRAFRKPRGHCDSARSGLGVQRRQLARSLALWSAQRLQTYAFRIGTGGFPTPGSNGPVTVKVVKGRPSDSRSPQLLRGYLGTPLNTVPNLFRTIRRALDDPRAGGVVAVRYDSRRGFPASAFVDPIKLAVDDEFSWTVDRFRSLAVPGGHA